MLIPPINVNVRKVMITDGEPHGLHQGIIYSFAANLTDIATIPKLGWTNIIVGRPVTVSEPWIWRIDAARQDICMEVEDESDAGLDTMKTEARKAWCAMSDEIVKRARWLSLVGLHRDIVDRAQEPLKLRQVEIRTFHDDMLARMFAVGSAEIARIAGILHDYEERTDREPIGSTTVEKFLWGQTDGIPDWAQARYDQALAGGFRVLQSRFAPQDELAHE
jgi:hypothetical protein